MITRSANGASRSPAIHSASGSRSIPMTFKPANSVRNRSACPPAPRVASTSTAPDPSALCRITAGRSSSTQRSSRTGMWPLMTTTTDERLREEETTTDERLREEETTTDERLREEETPAAPRSLSDDANLALGKYARVGSGRGHDARATCRSASGLDNVAQSFMGGRGEVFFVGLLVALPGLGVPDLQVLDRSGHHAVLRQVRVATMVGRQGDPALGVRALFVGGGSH